MEDFQPPSVGARAPNSEWVRERAGEIAGEWRMQANREAKLRLACLWSEILTNVRMPRKNGATGITPYGKKMVRSAATLLQRRHGRHKLTFLTLTVPEMSRQGLLRVASQWGELLRQLFQWLRRNLQSQGLPASIISVTECQPKRLKSGSLGCLHVHATFVGWNRAKKRWALHYLQVRKWWLKALSRIAGERVESQACEQLKRVEKSVAGYLGKYMSKGGDGLEEMASIYGPEVVPGQWWNATAEMRRLVREETRSGEDVGEILESLVNSYFLGESKFPGFLQAHHVSLDGFQYLVAYGGRVDDATRKELMEWLSTMR